MNEPQKVGQDPCYVEINTALVLLENELDRMDQLPRELIGEDQPECAVDPATQSDCFVAVITAAPKRIHTAKARVRDLHDELRMLCLHGRRPDPSCNTPG